MADGLLAEVQVLLYRMEFSTSDTERQNIGGLSLLFNLF